MLALLVPGVLMGGSASSQEAPRIPMLPLMGVGQ